MLELQHIHKYYNAGTVNEMCLFDDFNLTVKDHQFVSVVGSNGSGKTSLLNIICGSIPLDQGTIRIGNADITRMPEYKRQRRIGRVYQNPSMGTCPSMTIAENMALADNKGKFFNLRPGANKHRMDFYRESLRSLGLGLEDKMDVKVGVLSGGQRQRVAIARALSLNPDAIIADEPTSALDVSVRAQILNLLSDLKKSLGLSLVFISHDIQTVRYVSDEIVVMNHGTIVERGAAYDVLNNPQDSYTKLLLGAAPSLLHPTAEECR